MKQVKMSGSYIRYSDDDRPWSHCYDCNLPYKDFPCDMLIQDDLWELINPTEHQGGGLLCPNCICARLIKLPGMTCVRACIDIAVSTGATYEHRRY